MNELATEARVRELGDEGAGLLPHEPALAAMKFEEARDLALHVGMTTIASTLSSLVARTWQLRGSPWRCIHFSRRAVQDEPQNGGAHSTLAHFCQKAATKAKASGKLKRSLHLFVTAANAYAAAATLEGEDKDHAATLACLAGYAQRDAQQVFADWWEGSE